MVPILGFDSVQHLSQSVLQVPVRTFVSLPSRIRVTSPGAFDLDASCCVRTVPYEHSGHSTPWGRRMWSAVQRSSQPTEANNTWHQAIMNMAGSLGAAACTVPSSCLLAGHDEALQRTLSAGLHRKQPHTLEKVPGPPLLLCLCLCQWHALWPQHGYVWHLCYGHWLWL